MHGERTRQWKSEDSLEAQVRGALLRADVFENHWLDETEQGEFLPQMTESIPGQYDAAGHGIDIFAIDQMGALWIIEVSRGRKYGAIVAKGGGKPVKSAGNELQMSATWRDTRVHLFLDGSDGIEKARDLLHLSPSDDDRLVKTTFLNRYRNHKKAIIIPLGGHFDAIGTDINFNREVFTYRSAARRKDLPWPI